MWNLDYKKYEAIHAAPKKVLPWIVPKESMNRLSENASFLKALRKAHPKIDGSPNVRLAIQEFRKKFRPKRLSDTETFKELGIASTGIYGDSFMTLKSYKSWRSKAKLRLLTERFFSPPANFYGSSRHGLLYDLQVKGMGRNLLCTQEEVFHAWGGHFVKDALMGYLQGGFAKQRTLLPPIETLALLHYAEPSEKIIPESLVLRDAHTFRLAQVHPNFCTEGDAQEVRTHLSKIYPGATPGEILKKIAEHYVHAFSQGVLHRSLTFDNLTVDGRWIDTESMDILPKAQIYPQWISILGSKEDSALLKKLKPNPGILLRDFLNRPGLTTPSFLTSWIHHLQMAVRMTAKVYEGVFPSEKFQTNAIFLPLIETHLKSLNPEPWKELVRRHETLNARVMGLSGPGQLEIDRVFFQTAFGDLHLTDSFFDASLQKYVITFSSQPEDFRVAHDRKFKKWEVAFRPEKKASLARAHELAETAKDLILGYST
ncbi:MAG: hypothetical protein JNL01_00550 [Bdellovibrionales bacterium]|nr:hypothetical protein [Bdellovibrionales bacterium]